MHMGWHTMGREQTHSSQKVEQLCPMVFLFSYTYPRGFNFPSKKRRQLLGIWVFSQTSLFFSPHFMVVIASLSVQMVPVTSTEETYQKRTISEGNQHCIFRHSCADHRYSAGVLRFQWKTDFYLQVL